MLGLKDKMTNLSLQFLGQVDGGTVGLTKIEMPQN
jgi:hypothetical protein